MNTGSNGTDEGLMVRNQGLGGPVGAPGRAAFRLDLKRAWAMHRALALLVGCVVFVLVMGYGLTRKVLYQAETVFLVPPVQKELLAQNTTPAAFDATRYDATSQQLIQTLERQDTVDGAVRSLPVGVWRQRGESVPAASARLLSNLSVDRVGTSFQLSASLKGPSAEDTTAALNALSKKFLNMLRQEQSGASDGQMQLLKEELVRVQSNLAQSRAEQTALGATLGVARLGADETDPFDSSVADMRRQISDLRHARDLVSADIASGGGGDGGGGGEGGGGGGNTTTSGLITSLNSRKATLQSQMTGMTSANPIYQQDQLELEALNRELVDATHRSNAETQARAAERRAQVEIRARDLEAKLRGQLAERTAMAVTVSPKLQQYSQLTSDIERMQTRASTIEDSIRSMELEANGPGTVRVAVPPMVPTEPIPGNRRLILLAAFPLALLFGLGAAVVAQNRDGRIFLATDMERVLGFKPMAVLPSHADVSAPVADAYLLRLAAGIENAYRKGAHTFVFTSTNAGTEVEELVYKTQVKLKELGYSALWISAETLLRAERDFEQAYGRGPALDMEARYSEKGTDGLAIARLAWLKQDYDLVLIDAPHLTSSVEAEYAVRRTDAVILVNESGVTTKADLMEAGELLERVGLNGIGAVIKDLKLRDADPSYRNAVQNAERITAKPVQREPRDSAGAWQLTNGTHLPGDPVAPRFKTSTRESGARHRASQIRASQTIERPPVRDTDREPSLR